LILGNELRDERRDVAVVTQAQPETYETGAEGPSKRARRPRRGIAAESFRVGSGELAPELGAQLENVVLLSLTVPRGSNRKLPLRGTLA
jgi:hypothetical protein